jgi:hypothetical protein
MRDFAVLGQAWWVCAALTILEVQQISPLSKEILLFLKQNTAL